MKFLPSSLRIRLLLFVALAMLPIMGLEVYMSLRQRREAALDATDEALRLANLAAITQRDLLQEMNQFMATLALLPPIQQVDVFACNGTLAGLLDLHPYTANLGFIDREGDLLCSALPFTPPIYVGDRAFFLRTMERNGFAVGDYQLGIVTGIPSIIVGYPVMDPGGDTLGVVFAAIDLSWVNLLATEAELPEGSTVTSVDPTGIVLSRYPDSDNWVSESIADTPLFAAVSTQSGEGIAEVEGIDGSDRLYGYTPLLEGERETPYLIVGIPTRVVYGGVNRSLAQSLIGLTVIAMLGLVAAWMGSDAFLVRDVKKLVNVANRLTSGQLDVRADTTSATSELGELARAFNDMAESLEGRVEQLEQTENRLKRINRSLKVLSASNQMVVRSKDEASLLSRTCDILVKYGGYRMAWVGFAEKDEEKSVRPLAQSGVEDDYLEKLGITWADSERGRGPTGTAIRTGEPSMARHILTDPTFKPWREQALKRGYQSSLALPLTINGEIIGALNVFAAEPDAFDTEEIELLEETAEDLSYGITALRVRESHEKSMHEVQLLKDFNEGIVNTITEGILMEDVEGRFSFVNPAAARILGYDIDELIGLSSTAITLPDQLELAQRMSERRRSGITDQYELELVRKDGERLVALINASPRVEGGHFVGSLIAITDITILRAEEKRAQLRERLATVGELAAGIAHDFNNILGAIILLAQRMQKFSALPDDDRQRLDTIAQQARRGADLVAQILDFSRKAIMDLRSWDLSHSLNELRSLLERTLPENIAVHFQYGDVDYTVHADPTRMQQVIMNLAVNARDAMLEGGELRFELERIRVESGKPPFRDMPAGEWVRLMVTDTGCGIPEDVLPRIFEPFFTTKPVGEGTGLGLAQVYGIVKQHDGYIDVTSEMGQGTRFIIYLPFYQGTPMEIDERENDERLDGLGRTILLVEDDATIREAAAELLRSLNFKVIEVFSGKEAIDIFTEGQLVDLVISDLVMPDMGGRELYETLREGYPEVKMILMTGYPLGDGTRELLDQQKVTWMKKPFSDQDLARTLRRILR